MNGVLLVQNASDDIQEVEEKKTNGGDNNVMEVQIDDEKENGEIEEVNLHSPVFFKKRSKI